MTFTTGLRDHDVVMAVDKSNEHTGVSATEGDSSFTFDNTSNTIDVGDLVFCSDQDDNNVQYLGLCTADNGAGGIETEFPLQTTPGTSLKIWEPTTSVRLQWRLAIGGQEHQTDDGTQTVLTRGAGTGFQFTTADESKILPFRFDPSFPGDYEVWRAFRATRARSTTQPSFSLAFWDQQVELSKVHEVLAIASGRHSVVQPAHFASRFRQSFFVVAEDTYAGT